MAAQFSLPWSLANAIIYRKLKIEHFSNENLKNQEAYQLAHKVVTQLDPQLTRRGERGEREPAVVEIRTREGMVYSKRVDHPLGSPENPLSMEGIVEKFRSCASYAAKPIPEGKLEQTVQMVEGLEDVADVGQLIRLLG